MFIPKELKDEIVARNDIVDVLSEYISLKKCLHKLHNLDKRLSGGLNSCRYGPYHKRQFHRLHRL